MQRGESTGRWVDWAWWAVGILLGIAAGCPHVLASSRADGHISLWLTPLLTLLVASTLAACQPEHLLRGPVAVGMGLPLFVIARIIFDSAKDPTSHNLFPFEIVLALIVSVPASLAGAFLGFVVRYAYDALVGRGRW